MNANNTFRTSYHHAARVCILLEVFKNQKFRGLTRNFSTDFSTGEVESSRRDVSKGLDGERSSVTGRRLNLAHPNQQSFRRHDRVPDVDANHRRRR